MEYDPAITEAVSKALLRHFWFARDNGLPRAFDFYPKGYLISYKQLMDVSGVHLDPRNAGGPLFHIAAYCDERGWPPINSLVVRKDERSPGDGYFAAPGSTIDSDDAVERMHLWAKVTEDCLNSDKYPREVPHLS